MIGYHYTSEANWLKIREEGMRPYALRKDIVDDEVLGIWLFTERQHGQSHAGCILFQINTKRTLDVVELAVAYDIAKTQRRGWENYIVKHEGKLHDGDKRFIAFYHRAAPATIVWHPIPPEQIQLLGVYRFKDAWTQVSEQITVGLHEQAHVRKVTR